MSSLQPELNMSNSLQKAGLKPRTQEHSIQYTRYPVKTLIDMPRNKKIYHTGDGTIQKDKNDDINRQGL